MVGFQAAFARVRARACLECVVDWGLRGGIEALRMRTEMLHPGSRKFLGPRQFVHSGDSWAPKIATPLICSFVLDFTP